MSTAVRLYFGCWEPRHLGHGFYTPGGRSARQDGRATPWGMAVDGGLAPRAPRPNRKPSPRDPECPQGAAALHHRDGWTALSFWDRTGDSRGNSSSTFLLERPDATFEEMVAMARENFPEIVGRLPFEIALAT